MKQHVTAGLARGAGAVVSAVTTLLTAVLAWFAVWSAPVNGDEAYLLTSLREWVIRGGLYDRVYSQYGPFYYTLFGLPSRVIDARWTLAAGRVTTVVLWVVAAFLFGVAARAITGRFVFGIAAQVLSFSILFTVVNEPMHPGALLCALLAALLANVAWLRHRAPVASDGLSGVLAAALVLTKVNVGLFAVVALVFVVGQGARDRRWRWCTEVALVAFGPALLLANGQERWRLLWASVYAAAAVAVVVASRVPRGRESVRFHVGTFYAGFAAVSLICIGVVLATGTTAPELIRAVLVRPLEHPRLVTIPVRLPAFAWLWVLVVPLACALWWRRAAIAPPRLVLAISGVGRLVAGGMLMVSVLGPNFGWGWNPTSSRFALLPLAALVLVPRRSSAECVDLLVARRFLAAAALTESMHAFPVPGSQISWSVVTAGVVAVVVVADGMGELVALSAGQVSARVAAAIGAAACLGVVLVLPFGVGGGIRVPGDQFREWFSAYDRQLSLGIEGTGRLRPPAAQRAAILATVPVIRRECDTAVTLGADLSWLVLADRRPPTGFNHPSWPSYLDDHEQRATVAVLRRFPGRTCLLLSGVGGERLGDRVTAASFILGGPLVRYLEGRQWAPVGNAGGVQVLRAVHADQG